MGEAYKANDTKALENIEQSFDSLMEEDRTEYAQGLIDKLLTEFPRCANWLTKMQDLAENKFYVYSPIGRVRHLFAAMTQDRTIVGRQVRRGMNAPIQGFASEVGIKASYLIMDAYYQKAKTLCAFLGVTDLKPIKFNRAVHDAVYMSVPFEMVIPFIHIMQHQATYGVAQAYNKEFGLKFTVEPEIEIEVGVRDSMSYKWDWSLPELRRIIEKAVDDGIEQKIYTQSREEILETIFAPWSNSKSLEFLDSNYPLLGVSLIPQIKKVLK